MDKDKKCLLPCLICGNELETIFDSVNQPSEGTSFATHGHYGSTFWDSFDGEELVINICDECLRSRKDRLGVRQSVRMVTLNKENGVLLGSMEAHRELETYLDHEAREGYPARLVVTPEQIGLPKSKAFPYHVRWHDAWEDIKELALRGEM